MRVAVIGGGPSGLTTLKYLKEAHRYLELKDPINVTLFEEEQKIGGTFRYRTYEGAELVSSKYLTAFSDFRLPKDTPEFLSPERYVQYLRDYCTHFDLWRHIQCSTKVVRLQRNIIEGGHDVTTDNHGLVQTFHFDAIAVCSGLNVEPAIPYFPGLETVPTVLHSSEFKNRKQLQATDKPTIVVLGVGETGMDLGHLAITLPDVGSVVMCHRDGFFCAPKRAPNPIILRFLGRNPRRLAKPMDTTNASLFDSAYVHPKIQRGMVLWTYYTWVIKFLLQLVTGTSGLDQWVGLYGKERYHTESIFLCKSDRAMPYISASYRKKTFWNRVRSLIVNIALHDTGGRHIELAPWPTHIDEHGVMHFETTSRPESARIKGLTVRPDVVLFATGYTKYFSFLPSDGTYPAGPRDANVRGIYASDDVTLAFIGFARPGLGAIPPLAEMQAQLWVLRLLESCHPDLAAASWGGGPRTRDPGALAPYELSWRLLPNGGRDPWAERGGVDHDAYAYQLALDVGAAPRASVVLRRCGWRGLWTWAMGSNFNSKFRLVGPWRRPEVAREVLRGELFDVTRRSGGLVFFVFFTLLPLLAFGSASLALYLWDWLVGLFCGRPAALGHVEARRETGSVSQAGKIDHRYVVKEI